MAERKGGIDRRTFLKTSSILVGGAVLATCGPESTTIIRGLVNCASANNRASVLEIHGGKRNAILVDTDGNADFGISEDNHLLVYTNGSSNNPAKEMNNLYAIESNDGQVSYRARLVQEDGNDNVTLSVSAICINPQTPIPGGK